MNLTPHFRLQEFLPRLHPGPVPDHVLANLEKLAELLERIRAIAGAPLVIHSGWRTRERNLEVVGQATSDHLTGSAADFHPAPKDRPWQDATIDLFHRLTGDLPYRTYGQLILEDRRLALRRPGALCIHVSLPTLKHPGTDADPSRLMVSYKPGEYDRWSGDALA